MDAKQEVERAQTESEATRDEPLPEYVKGSGEAARWCSRCGCPLRSAARAGVPVSALIRGWVLQGLATEQGTSLRDGIERLAADADRLRRLAAAGEEAVA